MTLSVMKHFWKETDKTGVGGRTSQRSNHRVGQCFDVHGESVSRLIFGSKLLRNRGFKICGRVGSSDMVSKLWDKPLWEKVWSYLDPWDSVRLRTASTYWNDPGKYGPHVELFFLYIKKEQMVTSSEVLPNPYVSAETLRSCALIGLRLLTTDYEVESSGSQFPDLGNMWKYGCPKSSIWSNRNDRILIDDR